MAQINENETTDEVIRETRRRRRLWPGRWISISTVLWKMPETNRIRAAGPFSFLPFGKTANIRREHRSSRDSVAPTFFRKQA